MNIKQLIILLPFFFNTPAWGAMVSLELSITYEQTGQMNIHIAPLLKPANNASNEEVYACSLVSGLINGATKKCYYYYCNTTNKENIENDIRAKKNDNEQKNILKEAIKNNNKIKKDSNKEKILRNQKYLN